MTAINASRDTFNTLNVPAFLFMNLLKYCFWCITSEIFQLTYWYRYQVEEEIMTNMWSIKEISQRATLGIPKGKKKYNFYFYCFQPRLFDQKWKYNFQGTQNKKKAFVIILHVEWVLALKSGSLTQSKSFQGQILLNYWITLPTLKACNKSRRIFDVPYRLLWNHFVSHTLSLLEFFDKNPMLVRDGVWRTMMMSCGLSSRLRVFQWN